MRLLHEFVNLDIVLLSNTAYINKSIIRESAPLPPTRSCFYLVGTVDLLLQLHLVLPLPQHLLAEGRQAGPEVFQLGTHTHLSNNPNFHSFLK